MTPLELFNILREVIADESGCHACWEQHPQPLSGIELAAIQSRILQVLQVEREHNRLPTQGPRGARHEDGLDKVGVVRAATWESGALDTKH